MSNFRKDELSTLTRLPSIEITYASAERQYGAQVARIVDKLAGSKADGAKKLPPAKFTWRLVYQRADDPPEYVKEPTEFCAQLCANSKAWLKATGGKWIGYEEIMGTPDKVLATYEQYSRLICNQRKTQGVKVEGNGEVDYPDTYQSDSMTDILLQLDIWIEQNPEHNKSISSIARLALEQLIRGDSE